MRAQIVSRLILVLPTLVLVSVAVFSLPRALPGDVANLMVDENGYADDVATLRADLGLDRPIVQQYLEWAQRVFRGDFGDSLWTGEPVTNELQRRFPVSLELGVFALLIALVVGVPIGVLSSVKQDTWLDYITRGGAIAFLAIPSFWLATIVISVPATHWGWAPPMRYVSLSRDPLGNIAVFLTPSLIMGIHISAIVMRLTRTSMLDVLRQDYIRTARAKGLPDRSVIVTHALRNAVVPVITMFGVLVPVVLGNTIVFEKIFGLPGLGSLVVDSVTKRDLPTVQGIGLLFAMIVISVNLLVDMSYGWLDPRARA